MSEPARAVLKRAFSRLNTSADAPRAAELREDAPPVALTPVGEVRARERVAVTGTLRDVAPRPRGSAPALVAELHDGSAAISLVWLGRRQIPGIETGRRLTCYGRVAFEHDRPVIFNPRYELQSAGPQ